MYIEVVIEENVTYSQKYKKSNVKIYIYQGFLMFLTK